MKIAFDHQIFTRQRYGGVSRYFAQLAACLKDLHEEPLIFAGFYQNEYLRNLNPTIVRGGYTRGLIKRGQNIRYVANDVRTKLTLSRWGPDITHQTFYYARGRTLPNIPVVLTVYDMIDELFPALPGHVNEMSLRKREAVEQADHVICISHSTADDLCRLFGTEREKVSVVHLGFEVFSESRHAPCDFERPYLLYVGQRSGYKNFHRVMEVLATAGLHKEFDLVAFGGGAFSVAEQESIVSLGLRPDRVRQVSGDDSLLADLYCGARALVYPSLYEGFGLPPLEAMALNCPVASSNTSSMPEVCGPAAEYFDPAKTEEMVYALSRVLRDEQRRFELIQQGQQRITGFSWGKCARETRDVYTRILGRM